MEDLNAADPGVGRTGSRVRLPAWFDDAPWHRIDSFWWRDLRAPKCAHLVTEADGQGLGVLLRQAPNHADGSHATMCDLCRPGREVCHRDFRAGAAESSGRPTP
ncbi:FBP domain-containing protein [Streptomyces uncialis]|uniref:FBP domain-containing protein n=1 Tax=Streptomyces uncialis TaxID=1048205 RepID=UPI003806920F